MSAAQTRTFEGLTIPAPGTFVLDTAHTRIGFVARHLMITKVRGHFAEFSGSVTVAEDPMASTAELTIKAASISTGVADRDAHLASGDFLEAEKYPELTFRNAKIVGHDGESLKVQGDLTIKDVTRPVTLDVEFEGVAVSPWGSEVIGFSISTELDREDFGMTWNQALETGGVMVGKKVKIEIEGEAVRQA